VSIDRALLVGINAYPNAPLRGCVNDVLLMTKLLHEHGFDDKEITLLTDRRATKAQISRELQRLVRGLEPGDRIIYHFSGHGVQLPARDDEGELDGLDECQCPVDFDFSRDSAVVDDEIEKILARVPAGVEAIVISDSCHSGTLDRNLSPITQWGARFMPLPADLAWDAEVAKRRGMRIRSVAGRSGASPHAVVITGCEPDQTSADAPFREGFYGALTYHLVHELRSSPRASLRAVMHKAQRALVVAGFSQRPTLTGPGDLLDRPFFGTTG
jgi:hypothetical protein